VRRGDEADAKCYYETPVSVINSVELSLTRLTFTHLIKVIKQHVEEDGVWQCEADGPARVAAVCVE
jgi:hypothetical protein